MPGWREFAEQAPRIAAVFHRRHQATGHLCLLGTLRRDGSPRISPIESHIFEDELWLGGMPRTVKFADLVRDPRFELHTATIDPRVGDGDAKVWGVVEDVLDPDLHARYAQALFDETGFDLRGRPFEHLFRADLIGGASVHVGGGHLDLTSWVHGSPERVVRKH
ncbi:MAG: pyridoxamine 5'-phosphate oxidase family protein [Solirubrobacterales bacterium]|nr:pyridoxamine 5'-phosphate oxidase family protein [Solirubrobacterales bacterium]